MIKQFRHNVVFAVVKLFMALFERTPRGLALFFGAALGNALFHIQRKDEFRAERHLRAAYPGRFSKRQTRAVIMQTFLNAGLSACDTVRLRSHYTGELAGLIDVVGLEHFENMYRRGKGVIAATGHIGNFELLAAFFGRNGYKTGAIGRKLYQERLDGIIVENRLANSVTNIPTTQVRKFLRLLQDGFAVGVLIDNDSSKIAGEFVESCGRLAKTPTGPIILGMRAGAAFMPLACTRVGKRYRLQFFPEEQPLDFGESAEDKRRSAIELSWRIRKVLDTVVEPDPSQWLWTHNRWRSRPDDSVGIGQPFGVELWRDEEKITSDSC